MSDIKKQASKMLAEEIIRAIKKMTDDNNKQYVNPQLRNYRFTTDNLSTEIKQSISNIASNSSGAVDKEVLDQAIQDAFDGYEIDVSKVIGLDAKVAEITVLEVEKATIDTAQIENLYATVADIIYLAAEKAEIGDLEAQKITSAIADLGLANIGSADIGFAQIKDLVSDTAIIREGVGGKLYIDRLAVTDAQILSLTTGELVMQGSDGKLYTVYVDDEGVIQTKLRVVTGNDIGSGTINGSNIADGTILGDNIAENTITGALITEHGITARELNVSQIFADEALIGAIKAANIDVADLSANQAFIGLLTTSLIQAPNFGSQLDISKNASIELTNERIGLVVKDESTETELVLTEQMLRAITGHIQLIADEIDLSANETIKLNVAFNDVNAEIQLTKGQLTGIAKRLEITESEVEGLSANISEAKATLTPDGLNAIVEKTNVVKTITGDIIEAKNQTAQVAVTANKIYWLIDSSSGSSSELVLTEDAVNVISKSITLTAEQLNLIANNVDMSENASIKLIVGTIDDKLKSKANIYRSELPPENANVCDLWIRPSAGFTYQLAEDNKSNPQFYIDDNGVLYYTYEPYQKVYELFMDEDGYLYITEDSEFIAAITENGIPAFWQRVQDSELAGMADELEGRIEGSFSEITQRQDSIEATINSKVDGEELRTYLRYADGRVELGRSGSRYVTQTSDNGFVVLQDGAPMASIVQNTMMAPVIEANRMFAIGGFALRMGAKGHLILA